MQALKTQTTRSEYLKLDELSPEKHEFYDGQIFAMAGGTLNHATIGLNTATTLKNLLRGKPCKPMNSDMRVHTPSSLDTYPDISVYCNEPELSDNNRTLHNPVVIIEVLSPTTQSYDRGDKFWHYRSIPTLRDYLLIDSESIYVEHYHRQTKDEWLMHEYRQLTDEIKLEALNVSLSLANFYEDITIE